MAKGRKTELYEVEWRTISIRTIKIIAYSISAGLLLFIYIFWVRNQSPPLGPIGPGPASAARFIDYDGKVEVKAKEEFVWQPASFKMDLHEGDRVRTEPGSSARIKFDDGTEITIQTDSIVVISKGAISSDREESAPLVVIEGGQSDINAEKSSSAPSVSTERIPSFKLAPGSRGSATADVESGVHTTEVDKGFGVVTDSRGRTTQLNSLEQMKIDRNDVITTTKLPFTPPLLSPQKGQLFEFFGDQGLTIELKWRDVTNAARYHVQISESPLFGKVSAENTNLTKSSITIKIPKTHKKQYFWRVRSIDKENNKSPWSEPFQFVVQTPGTSTPLETLDKTAPVLQITYMHPFLPFVQVEGKTEPDAFLTLNGQIIDVKEDGTFVYTYTLQKTGLNDLLFVAEDPSGNKTSVAKKVEY